jgi:hypothetical protein
VKNICTNNIFLDLNGIDTRAHNGNPEIAIKIVRDWLRVTSGNTQIDGHVRIIRDYKEFINKLPEIVANSGLELKGLTFTDYCLIVEESLSLNMG